MARDRRAGNAWVEVTGSAVNLREGPALSHPPLTSFRRGEQLRALEQRGTWTRVEHGETGKVGWMHSAYLKNTSDRKSVSASPTTLRQEGSGA